MLTAVVTHSDAQEMDDLKPGASLLHGQYKIESFLSSGGFGITYLARDSLDRRVVIKECFPNALCRRAGTSVAARSRAHQAEFRSVVKLFVREAWSLSKLTHPNIVGVHQVFEDNDTAYMALDYIDGFDLLETIEDDSMRLSPREISNILRKILSAVAFVHDQDMLHRDISPDNILIDRKTGNPVLIDFGAAREEVSRVNRVLSELRVVKDGYSPQEFYVNGSSQGPSSDLYALAATFYHLIRGEAPPVSQARLFAIASQQADPYVPLDGTTIDGYDVPFLEAINRALNVLPKDRLQSAQEWLRMISSDAARSDVAAAEKPGANVTAFSKPQAPVADGKPARSPDAAQAAHVRSAILEPAQEAPRPKSKKPLLLASAAAIVVAGGLAVGLGGSRGGGDAVSPAVDIAQPATVQTFEPAPVVAALPEAVAPAVTAESVGGPAAPPASAQTSEPEPEVAALPEADTTAVTAESTDEPAAPPATVQASEPDPEVAAQPEADAPAVTAETTDEPAAPPTVEPDTPAATVEMAASEAPEIASPVDAQPEAIALPEGAEPVAPAEGEEALASAAASTEAAAPEPETAAADQAGSQRDVSAEPNAIQSASPLSTELAMAAVTEVAGLHLPFFHDGYARTAIATVADGAEDWMAAGQRIVEVNGEPIRAFEDIPVRLRADIDAAVEANETTVEATFGVEAYPGAEIIRKSVALSIVPEIAVTNGVTFQIVPTEAGPRPMVTAVPPNTETELRVGDIIQLYLAKGEQVETGADFREILLREIALGTRLLNFAASRNGEAWLASLKVEMDS
jgi:serine/threonine protein kinase